MTAQSDRCRAMLPICSGIGKGMQIDCQDCSILCGTDFHMHAHFMAGIASHEGLLSCIDELTRLSQLPCHESSKNFCTAGLLGTKAAPDARFDYFNLRFGKLQGIGNDAADMKGYLCGANHIQTPVGIHKCIGTKGFHHRLRIGQGMVITFQNHIAF